MALVVGTNCGLVESAPSADPTQSSGDTVDGYSFAIKVTPTEDITITEIGWWCDTASQEANFEVGLYSHNAGTDEPNELLTGADKTNAKGTGAGWKVCTGLSLSLTADTTYWIAVQLDNVATTTKCDYASMSGQKQSFDSACTTLPATWVKSTSYNNYISAIYGVYETGGGTGHEKELTEAFSLSEEIIKSNQNPVNKSTFSKTMSVKFGG